MKANWYLSILWSVLSLSHLSCALDTDESPFRIRKRTKSKPPGTGDRGPFTKLRLAGTRLGSRGPYLPPPLPPPAPRSVRPGDAEAKTPPDFAYLPDVSVTCSTSDFVVRVKPSFYGLGAGAEELKLGSSCNSNGVLRPYGDLLFTYPLTSCDAVREVRFESVVLRRSLHNPETPMSLSLSLSLSPLLPLPLTVALRLSDLQICAPL